MAHITNTDKLTTLLREFIKVMEKKSGLTIPEKDKKDIIDTMVPAMQKAGGLDDNDPQVVNKLKHGIVTALVLKTVPENNKDPMKEVMSLTFKDENKLTAKEKLKVGLGMAYIKALEKDSLEVLPKMKVDMKLLFKAIDKPHELSKDERFRLSNDLDAVQKKLEGDPKFNDLNKCVKDLKDKIDKEKKLDTVSPFKSPNDQLAENMRNLFGGGSPLVPAIGEYNGLPVTMPAFSGDSKVLAHKLKQTVLSDSGAATGTEAAAAANEESSGIDARKQIMDPDSDYELLLDTFKEKTHSSENEKNEPKSEAAEPEHAKTEESSNEVPDAEPDIPDHQFHPLKTRPNDPFGR